jgi:hypothetical protein
MLTQTLFASSGVTGLSKLIVRLRITADTVRRLRSPLSIIPVEILFRLFRNVHHHGF